MNKRAGMTLGEVVLAAAVLMIVFLVIAYPFVANSHSHHHGAASAQNNRQMCLAGIMYGGDYDDTIPITTNGWLCRLQNISDKQLTVNCPAPGTQDLEAKDAAGGPRTDAWPLRFIPYIKSRGLFYDPNGRPRNEEFADQYGIWHSPPHAASDAGYDPEGATYRNQNRFPMYGMNYMFLSPLRIPAAYRKRPNAINYAVSESHKFTDADDPSGTVYFTETQRSLSDIKRGFFVVNAPGMWEAFANGKNGLVAFWSGTAGSGDWVGTNTACADFVTPCPKPIPSANFIYMGINGGCNASFLDGHVKYYKAGALAAGTDYMTATAKADGSGAHIIDKKKYLWNLDNNFYGL